MKIAFIFNNSTWSSEIEKVQNICNFFSTVYIESEIHHTTFTNIPFITVATTDGHQGTPDTLGTAETVNSDWYDTHITPLTEADIILFCITQAESAGHITPIGIDNKVHAIIFGVNETNHAYVNGKDLGNEFELFAEHEISHALYYLSGKPDRTHEYFYAGNPQGVLKDFADKVSILKRMLQACLQLLGLLKIQQTMQPIPIVTEPIVNPPISKIELWAKAIQQAEGWKPGSPSQTHNNPGNLGYTTLTASWGATQGGAKSDGGHFCKFPDYVTGFKALCNFLTLGAEDELKAFHQARTLELFSEKYGNTGVGYAQEIANTLHVPLSTDVSTFLT